MADTWLYRVPEDPKSIPDEWVWERLRNLRNELIASCDWRVVPDAPWDTAPWITYRQELRDLTACTDPRQAVIPSPPSAEPTKAGPGVTLAEALQSRDQA